MPRGVLGDFVQGAFRPEGFCLGDFVQSGVCMPAGPDIDLKQIPFSGHRPEKLASLLNGNA